MKIRRIVATAVAAAVTTPVVLLSAAPAFADTKPAATAEQQDRKPTIEELKLGVEKAQKAYDAAVIAHDKAEKAFDDLQKDGSELKVKAQQAKAAAATAAEEAAKAKKAVDDAQKKLDEAAEADKPAAQQELDTAKAAQATADATAKTADETAKAAQKTFSDALVAAAAESERARQDKVKASDALKAAQKALDEALAEDPDGCEDVYDTLTLRLSGPKKITAGKSGDFSLRITNGTGLRLDRPSALVNVIDTAKGDGSLNKWVHVKASVNGSSWNDVPDADFGVVDLKSLDNRATAEVKFRVTVDAKAPKITAAFLATADYDNNDGSCGWGGGAFADFDIVKAAKPAPGKPGTGSTGGNGNTSAQGGSSKTPVTSTGTTGGTLAKTGAGSATMPIALAGGAALVLGAGAVVVGRRRKAGADA
ncbi:LPXTG cell wall anchor domain-containing protein [Streptomyces sp. NPDC053493]|uniref:LPXTG cell wall anchor domain-containing protein n=1 Tax=Streptomyces sp. NPDC053493 TaxID=3365705 RepID=UPI0037D43B53